MRDPARIDRMLELIRKQWNAQPDLRLTQLILNAVPRDSGWSCPEVYHFEDDKLEAILKQGTKP